MDKYIIKGGARLVGDVEISGAKNAALALLATTLMTDEKVVIDNLPDVKDINIVINSIAEIGAKVDRRDRNTVAVQADDIYDVVVNNEYVKKIRTSYYLLGALLGRYKYAEVTLPGGCNIGSRPIDQHIKGFKALGAKVKIEHGMISADAREHGLVGNNVYFDVVSVGAPISVMLAATLAEGKTRIENAAKEPQVVDVANMLNTMGANIKGAGTDVIRISGVKKLHKTEYSVIPDPIEAATFMMAAVVTKGNILVKNVIPKHLEAVTAKILETGSIVEEFDDAIRVIGGGKLETTHIKTLPYPGFPTDMQPQFTVALCLAGGTSTVTESLFESRFKYVDELTKMGADIRVEGNTAIIRGVDKLSGAEVNALDLRAGAALVLAGIVAEGFTTVEDVYFIQRGYERFPEKLRKLGATIELVTSEKEEQKFRLRVG